MANRHADEQDTAGVMAGPGLNHRAQQTIAEGLAREAAKQLTGEAWPRNARGRLTERIMQLRAEANRLEQLERALPTEMIAGADAMLCELMQAAWARKS